MLFDAPYFLQNQYTLGEYFDLERTVGSRRVAKRPAPVNVTPIAAAAPAKRRRSTIKIPDAAPFPPAWFEGAMAEANPEDLQSMLVLLEQKEVQVDDELQRLDMELRLGDDLQKRADLEKKFEELCQREDAVMKELIELRKAEP